MSLFVFCLGLVIAFQIYFQTEYLSSLSVYLCVFGIAWVASWLAWGSRRIPRMLREIRSVFLVPDADYERATLPALRRRIQGAKLYLLCSIVPIVVTWAFVWLQTGRGVFKWFPQAWSQQPHVLVKNLIVDIYFVPVYTLVCTGAVGIVGYALLVWSLSKL